MPINERIRKIRKAICFTQAKFAKRIAISISYLGEIENGVKAPNERFLKLLIAEFSVDEHWLRTGKGNMFAKGIKEDIAKLISFYKLLNPQFQAYALKQIEYLAELQVNT